MYILLVGYHPFDPDGDATEQQILTKMKAGRIEFDSAEWNGVSGQALSLQRATRVLCCRAVPCVPCGPCLAGLVGPTPRARPSIASIGWRLWVACLSISLPHYHPTTLPAYISPPPRIICCLSTTLPSTQLDWTALIRQSVSSSSYSSTTPTSAAPPPISSPTLASPHRTTCWPHAV